MTPRAHISSSCDKAIKKRTTVPCYFRNFLPYPSWRSYATPFRLLLTDPDKGDTSRQWLNSVGAIFTTFWTSYVHKILIGNVTLIIGKVINGTFKIERFLLVFYDRLLVRFTSPMKVEKNVRSADHLHMVSLFHFSVAGSPTPSSGPVLGVFPIPDFPRLCREWYFFCHFSTSSSFCCRFWVWAFPSSVS